MKISKLSNLNVIQNVNAENQNRHFSDTALYFGNIKQTSLLELISGLGKWAPSLKKRSFKTVSEVIDYLNSPQGQGDKESIKSHLGGKAWSLLQMSAYADELSNVTTQDISVPEGFTLFTDNCQNYKEGETTESLWPEIQRNIRHLERDSHKQFGGEPPLVVSVRSGAAVSLPGAIETVLNIGLTRENLPSFAIDVGELVAWDSYCRLLEGYGSSVFGIDIEKFHNQVSVIANTKGS